MCFFVGDWLGKVLALSSLLPFGILSGFVALILFRRDLHTVRITLYSHNICGYSWVFIVTHMKLELRISRFCQIIVYLVKKLNYRNVYVTPTWLTSVDILVAEIAQRKDKMWKAGRGFWWHVIFLSLRDKMMQLNILISDMERRLQKDLFYSAFFHHFVLFLVIYVILASFTCHIFKVYLIFKSFFQVLLNFPVIYFLNNYIIMVKYWNEVLLDNVDNWNQNGKPSSIRLCL